MKMLACRFQQCLGFVNTLTLEGCSETGAFGHSRNHIFWSLKLQNYLSCEADLFFQNAENFIEISKMQ